MIWNILLSATIETGLGLLAEAGFGDSIRDFRESWLKTDQRKRGAALEHALNLASKSSGDPEIAGLLEHRPFQEEVIRALLDPLEGFNVQAIADYWGERFPEHVIAIRKFFNAFQNVLLTDPIWGPVLDRYQNLRFRQDVRQTLESRNLPVSDALLVRTVSAAAETYRASLKGDGAIAQGTNARAVGAAGMLVEGNIHQIVNITLNQFLGEKPIMGKTSSERDQYLRTLYRRCQVLPLVTLGDDPSIREDVTLNDVYVSLNTTTIKESLKEAAEDENQAGMHQIRLPREEQPVSAMQAAIENKRLVLLGDPGSGKSTFIRDLLARQALVLLGKQSEDLAGFDPDLMPVLITLRDLVPPLDNLEVEKLSASKRDAALVKILNEQIQSDLDELYQSGEFSGELLSSLNEGKVLLALDGLDEVPERLREKVRLAVAAYQRTYDLPRIIITCRIRSYTGAAEQAGFERCTLAPFTEEQIDSFCLAWYLAQFRLNKMDDKSARDQATDLSQAARQEELLKLAENPMLLTTMAIIHQKQTRLPNERVKLFSLAVQVLLDRWQRAKSGERLAVSTELASLMADSKRVRKILERMAYEAHQAGKDTKKEADISRKDALAILEGSAYAGSLFLAHEFLDYVDQRAGLLVGRGGEPGKPSLYSFAHRTFQEYLAGCYLINQRDASRKLLEHASEPEYWSLAVELGAEELNFNGRTEGEKDVLDLAYSLLADRCASIALQRAALWSGKMAALVGRETVSLDTSPHGGIAFMDRLLTTHIHLLESELTPIERAEAGRVLAVLGDPRSEVMKIEDMVLCRVPAGEFTMGEGKESHKVNLPEFFISRFPITNAQFDQFVKAEGYRQAKYWAEAEKAGYWTTDGFKGGLDEEPRTAPEDYGTPFNLANHPVVGVSWYESLAFTRWLDEQVRSSGQFKVLGEEGPVMLQDYLHFCLPSEAEWEKAARGSDGRGFPWGEEFNPNFANMDETGISTTSTVGCFPKGISPYGTEDLSGNVWEWMRSLHAKYPYKFDDGREGLQSNDTRVLRGGSFGSASAYARCASRLSNPPGRRHGSGGFRVVVSPFFPS